MTQVTRYPRPKGLTNLSRRYNDNPNKANKAKLNKAVITHYLAQTLLYPYPLEKPILNEHKDPNTHQSLKPNNKQRNYSNSFPNPSKGNKANNTPQQQTEELIKKQQKNNPSHNSTLYQLRIMEYKELCLMLGLKETKVQLLITKYLSKQAENYLDKSNLNRIEGFTRETIFGNFFGALNKALSHEGWVEELKTASREAFYKPSMVKEANSAIGTQQTILMNTQTMALNILKVVSGALNQGNPTNIQNNYYGNQPNIDNGSEPLSEDGYLLSPTKALQLMESKGLLELPTEADHAMLKAEYLTPDVPSTQALPSDAQGIQRKELVIVAEEEPKHEERREEGLESLNNLEA